jgi:hypothetical protein
MHPDTRVRATRITKPGLVQAVPQTHRHARVIHETSPIRPTAAFGIHYTLVLTYRARGGERLQGFMDADGPVYFMMKRPSYAGGRGGACPASRGQ